MTIAKARLIELDQTFKRPKPGGKNVSVQFNPESLKVTYANQLVEPKGGDKAAGTAGRQFVGAGTTKLALQLWFDVGAQEEVHDPQSTGESGIVDDVRRLTQHVVFFMTPQSADDDPQQLAPPGVRFEWGSFAFDGMVEGLDETIEFFSPDGKPLRATITMALSAQKILPRDRSKDGPRLPAQRGHQPLKVAPQNGSLQSMAAALGKADWQGIAAANGIEDPLRMAAGRFVDLHAAAAAAPTAALNVGAAIAREASSVSTNSTLNATFGGAAPASLSFG